MNKPKNQVKETAQQKALAEVASAQLADYKERWLPVQRRLAENIVSRGAADSAERKAASGRSSTDSAVAFGMGKEKVVDTTAEVGGGLNSGKAKMAITGTNNDESTSRGLGFVADDQAIDDSYLQGLGQLAAIGRGERGGAMAGMAGIANSSGRQAEADAEISAQRRAGNAQLIGQVAGFGMSAAMQPRSPEAPEPGGSGFQNIPGDFGFKNSPGGFGIKANTSGWGPSYPG